MLRLKDTKETSDMSKTHPFPDTGSAFPPGYHAVAAVRGSQGITGNAGFKHAHTHTHA